MSNILTCLCATGIALFSISTGRITATIPVQVVQRPSTDVRKATLAKTSRKTVPPKKVTERPYPISGIFLTDLRSRGGPAYPRTAPAIAKKYPGADLLLTVVADGKVILSPRVLRLKLPVEAQIPEGAFLDVLRLSSDGMCLAGLLWHGPLVNNAYTTHMDLCVLESPDGRMHRLTHDTFFSPFFGTEPTWEWSPDHQEIVAVEVMDKPPLSYYERESIRLVVLETRTGIARTLSQRNMKTEGAFQRYFWATSKSGERGVVFQNGTRTWNASDNEVTQNRTGAWFFVPVPIQPDVAPGPIRQITDTELPDYGISIFPSTVIKAQKDLRFQLSLLSPRSDLAVFHRDDSYDLNGAPSEEYPVPGPSWVWMDAGRTGVVDAAGKTLLNRDDKEMGVVSDWTWDSLLLTCKDSDPPRQYRALNPRTGAMQKAVVPTQVPYPSYQWVQLRPTTARRAAKYWRQAPSR